MPDKKVFDLTKRLEHQELMRGNGHTDDLEKVRRLQEEINRLVKEMKRVELLAERAYDLYAILHAQGYSESAKRARKIWQDLDEESSYLSEQWGQLVSTQMGWR